MRDDENYPGMVVGAGPLTERPDTAGSGQTGEVYRSIQRINESVKQSSGWIAPLRYEMSKVIIG